MNTSTRNPGIRVAVAGGLLALVLMGRAGAATLEDFGYQNMKVNGQPASGGRPTLVVLLDLVASGVFAHANAEYDNLVFNPFNLDPGTGEPRSVNGFMLVNSHGRFHLTRAGPGVLGPLPLSPDERSQGLTNDTIRAGIALIAAQRAGFDFAAYDDNRDGRITSDELLVLAFENAGEVDGGNARWANPAGVNAAFKPDGSPVTFAMSVANMSQHVSFATLCHEFSHVLGTLDLYGIWNVTCHNFSYSLMSCTITSADDRTSYHLDAWHKLQLGWLEPRIRSLAAGGVETLSAAQSPSVDAAAILYDPARGANEFFLVEYRTGASPWGRNYDDDVRSNGLGIWHVMQDGNRNLVQMPGVGQGVWLEGPPDLQRGEYNDLLWSGDSVTPALRWSDGTVTRARIFVRPFNSGDGSLTFEWLNEEVSWVDFAFTGFENGSFDNPFNTLGEGLNAVPHGGVLNFKPGSSREAATVSKRVTLQAVGGPVTLGQP